MPTPAVVRPTRSRNFLRDKSFIMGTSPARENDCNAEPRKRRGSPRAASRPAIRKGNGCASAAQQVSRIALLTAFLKTRYHSRRREFMHEPGHQDYLPPFAPRIFDKSRPTRKMV